MSVSSDDLTPLNVAVLTISDTRTLETDKSGAVVIEHLTEAGHEIVAREIVRDDIESIRGVVHAWITNGVEVVITTGGTGIADRDVTPEAIAPLVTRPIPGFGELFRHISYEEIGTSTILSRCEAARCQDTLVFLLPGSPGACRTAMSKIVIEQLDVRHRPCSLAEMVPRLRKS